jgi:hypothetical protein
MGVGNAVSGVNGRVAQLRDNKPVGFCTQVVAICNLQVIELSKADR